MSLNEREERAGQVLRKFDLNLLLIFEALITECHVTRAAQKVFLSQPAVSHALNRMRDELGDPLLVRTAKGMQPTPRALAMLPAVQQALKILEVTLAQPQAFDPSCSQRRFVIATTDYFEMVHFPLLLSKARQIAPGISFDIQLITDETLQSGLENRAVDLVVGLASFHEIPKGLQQQLWQREPLVCLVGEHNTEVGDALDVKAFIKQPHVVFTDIAGARPGTVDLWLARQQLSRETISCNLNYTAAARIVAHTDAIITLPKQMAELFMEMLPVRMVSPPEGLDAVDMTLIQHPLYAQDPAIVWLREQIERL